MPANYIGSRKILLQINQIILNIKCIKEVIIDAFDDANYLIYIHLENVPYLIKLYREDSDNLINFLKINKDDLNIRIE